MLSLDTDSISKKVSVSVVSSSISHDLFRYISYSGLVSNKIAHDDGRFIMLNIRDIALKMQQQVIELAAYKNHGCTQYKRKVGQLLVNVELSYTLWNVLLNNRSFERQMVIGHTKKAATIHRTAHMLLERIARNVLEHNLNRRVVRKHGNVRVDPKR